MSKHRLTGDDKEEDQIGGFDLIYKNDVERVSPLGPGTSRLGCLNDRLVAMKKLAKYIEARIIKEKQAAKVAEKSFDVKGKKVDEKRQTSTIPRINQRPMSIAKPQAKPTIPQLKEPVKINDTDTRSMGQSSSNTNAQNKNWIIRKSNSIRK